MWKDVKFNTMVVDDEGKTYNSRELAKLPYFAYGSNLYVDQMRTRCPHAQVMRSGKLEGYKLIFREYADVTKNKHSVVHGMLYKVKASDIDALNTYEGYPFKYDIRIGLIRISERETVKAFWYEMRDKKAHLTEAPRGIYFARIAAGYASHNLPSSDLYNSIRRAINAVNARKRKQALKDMEMQVVYDKMTWMDEKMNLGLIHHEAD
jgi:gamma-glutamylcyclotransferase (GGCT)/AIG2-like uncharacterized protein YtfP